MKKFVLICLIAFYLSLWFVKSGDPNYNCHAYAWTNQKVWLDAPPIQSAKEVDSGPIVVYFNNGEAVHSGKYLGYGWVKSKWGEKPVIYHPLYFSPYGHEVKFYERTPLEDQVRIMWSQAQ